MIDRFVDLIVIALIISFTLGTGFYFGKKVKTLSDYFTGSGSIPAWAATLSIVATETSALTFLSIPGLAYAGNLSFLQVAIGYILGRFFVAVYLIPSYASGGYQSVYGWISSRFGPQAGQTTSWIFSGTRLLADAVRLYATAIPLALLLKAILPGIFNGLDTFTFIIAILMIGGLTVLYTVSGGIRAVIWTDVIQWFIYVSGGIIALWFILSDFTEQIPPDFLEKLTVLSFEGNPFTNPLHMIPAILGGMVLSMASHGTDQIIVQRTLAVGQVKPAQRAMIASGFIVFFQFLLFLLVGAGLSIIFQGQERENDQVFSFYIIHHLPQGLSGVLIASLIAAAMSTLSSSINALASATVNDLFKLEISDQAAIHRSRWISLMWAMLLTMVAISLVISGEILRASVVIVGLKIASVTYGPLLGIFLLSRFTSEITFKPVFISTILTLMSMIYLVFFTGLAWTWLTLAGLVVFYLYYFPVKRMVK